MINAKNNQVIKTHGATGFFFPGAEEKKRKKKIICLKFIQIVDTIHID